MKKTLLIGLCIFLITIATATIANAIPDGGIIYYKFINTTDQWGTSNATNNGADTSTSYPVFNISGSGEPNSFNCDATANEYINTNYNGIDFGSNNYTFNFWVKSTYSTRTRWGASTDSDNYFAYVDLNKDFSGQIRIYADDIDLVILQTNDDVGWNDNNWHMITTKMGSDGTDWEIWLDGIKITSTTLTNPGSVSGVAPTHNNFICDYNNAGSPVNADYTGDIDEFSIYSRFLNQTEIKNLYNYGFIYNPSNIPPSITAKNSWNDLTITNFWAYINGTNYTTTNGTIFLDSELSNQTIQIGATNYFTSEFINQSFSNGTTTNYELKQSDITFNFLYSNGENIQTPSNFTRLDTNQSTVIYNGTTTIYPSEGIQNFNIKCNNDIFAPFNITLNITALENNTYNYTVNETQNVLTFYDSATLLPISGAEVTVIYPTQGTTVLTTNSSGSINFSYIKNDIVDFGTYDFSFDRLGYLIYNFSETINTTNIPFSKSYNMTRANITINVYNRSTGILLTGINVTINFVNLFNETVTTGTLTKNNLSVMQDEYTIYVSSDGYRTEARVFDFSNQENIEIDFYLLSLTDDNAGILTVQARDSFYRELIGAKAELLEYSAEDLSFISVSQCISNNQGECDFLIELNTKVYYIRGTYIDPNKNTLVAQTSTGGEIITTSGEVRTLIFLYETGFLVDGVANLIYNITESFEDNISQITFNFVNGDGTNVEGCIEYFRLNGSTYQSVTGNTYCLNATSAVQNIGTSITLNRSNNYKAEVYINRDQKITLKSFYYPNENSIQELFGNDLIGALVIFMWILSLALSLHINNISLFFIATIVLSWLEFIIFPSFSIAVINVFVTIISFITILTIRKVRENS